MTPNVSINVGETGNEFMARYPGFAKVTHSTPSVDYYEVNWSSQAPGTVVVERGKRSIRIEHVLGLQAPQELGSIRDEGLNSISIRAGITSPELIAHDRAKNEVYAMLGKFLAEGWQQVIERSEPRLAGEQRMQYTFATSSLNGLDASYVPALADWMRIENGTPWSFYADGLYLDIAFRREPTLVDTNRPGVYLLTFNIKTEAEYFRGFAGPENRATWRTSLQGALEKMSAVRAAKEHELLAKGYAITDSYRDPPAPLAK